MKYIKIECVSKIFEMPYEERQEKFMHAKNEPDKIWFYCPCDNSRKNFGLAHIRIKNPVVHTLKNKNPLHIEPSFLVTHGEGFCHFYIRNGKVEWLNDSTNPRK